MICFCVSANDAVLNYSTIYVFYNYNFTLIFKTRLLKFVTKNLQDFSQRFNELN